MIVSMKTKRDRAREMRKKGKSYGEISKELSVAKSTLSYWLKDILLSREQRSRFYTERIRKLAEGPCGSRARRQKEVDHITATARSEVSGRLTREAYRFFGAGLYWAEGSKGSSLQVTNSDPALIYFMVHWFGEMFDVDPKTFFAKLNIYPQQDENELKRFWSELCGIPLARFGKTYVKPVSKNVKRNNLYYGTIQITVPKGSNMKWHIHGWVQGALMSQDKQVGKNIMRWGHLREVERPINLR